jgi:hypothetical protein
MKQSLRRRSPLFRAATNPTLEQLIEVAKYYKIRWVLNGRKEPPQEARVALPSGESGATVRDLLSAIMSGNAEHQLTVENGVVHIASPVFCIRSSQLPQRRDR